MENIIKLWFVGFIIITAAKLLLADYKRLKDFPVWFVLIIWTVVIITDFIIWPVSGIELIFSKRSKNDK